jgi:dihydropteroate synthase
LQPTGVAAGGALPLAGGPLGFTACRLTVRRDGETVTTGDLRAAELPARAQPLLARLTQPRAPIAGLAFDRPLIMGVINVTADSFSDGGEFLEPSRAIAHGRALIEAGANLLDIGGESTRPGAAAIEATAERDRVLPVIAGLRECGVPLSIDTRKASVMRAAVAAGASLVNDVSALTHDAASLATVAELGVPVVLMHMRGNPATMQRDPAYADALLDIHDYLAMRIAAAKAAGIPPARLIVDPGIGFGKTLAHNLELLRGLGTLHALGCPLLIGVSRKSFLGRLGGVALAKDRLAESLAGALWALSQGAQILRVHDVAETVRAAAVWRALADPTHATNHGQSTKN